MTRLFLTISLSIVAPAISAANLTEEYCRHSADEKEIVLCIRQKVFDPCTNDSGSNGWYSVQCVYAHLTIANEDIKTARESISGRLDYSSNGNKLKQEFKNAEVKWDEYRKRYCQFRDTVAMGSLPAFPEKYVPHGGLYLRCMKELGMRHVKDLREMITPDD